MLEQSVLKNISPSIIWRNFERINQIPRASKKEERIVDFMMQFADEIKLDAKKDKIGNVIIKKKASSGMENRKTVVLQSHLDMVHQKNNDTIFDFETQAIKMYIDGDWVKAKGTTLGADNGLGVAMIMALLESSDIVHPPIEALFTVDEETGMTGAKELSEDLLSGDILLNLDTEDDNELVIGCAGGIDITATKNYIPIKEPQLDNYLMIDVKGLQGKHSGMDIHRGLGNANKIMNRILFEIYKKLNIGIVSIDGGGLRNAIPRESKAVVVIATDKEKIFAEAFQQIKTKINEEYNSIEPNISIDYNKITTPDERGMLPKDTQIQLLKSVYATINGVYRMSPTIEGLVEASNNIARVSVEKGNIKVGMLARSSVESSREDIVNAISSSFKLGGFSVHLSGEYPGWAPSKQSEILNIASEVYKDIFNKKVHICSCHAGLECGLIGSHYPNMDMISFGPNIRGAHSPDEKVSISSVERTWKLLLEILLRIPNAK